MRESTASKTSMLCASSEGMTFIHRTAAALFSRSTMVGARPITTSAQTPIGMNGASVPAGEVPQHAADDRHDHRAGIADGEHAGGDAVDVLGRADQRRQRQHQHQHRGAAAAPHGAADDHPDAAEEDDRQQRGQSRRSRTADRTTWCAPCGRPKPAAGTTPAAGRVLSAVSARVDQVGPPGVGEIVRQEAVHREIGGVDAAEQEADAPDHRVAEVRHPAPARGGRRGSRRARRERQR